MTAQRKSVPHTCEIESGVPLPPVTRASIPVRYHYPFRLMEPGDSFLVPFNSEPPERVRIRAATSARQAEERLGFAFETRTVAEGVRVWRTR